MKRIFLSLLTFITINVYAQQKGISYQAVILNPKGASAPGIDLANSPLSSKNVCMLFEIVDGASQVEYQESVQTSTDQFGMVNLIIGSGSKTGGYATSFNKIGWALGNKRLVVSINTNGLCSSYIKISDQAFMYAPYALFAENADVSDGNITTPKLADGAITDAKIGTGISASKVGLGNVNNTSDANKPVSTATQSELNKKENSINKSTATSLGTSDVLFPTQNAVKAYVDSKVFTGPQGIAGAKGDIGNTGVAGTNGLNGVDGAKGDTGATGSAGTNGLNGVDGAKGNTGATGSAGTNGSIGVDGAKGDTGANGSIGVDGAKGDTGANGSNGVDGAKGDTGATGSAGTNGSIGVDGAKGDTGSTGSAGTNGVDGAKGDTGAAGSNASIIIGSVGAANANGAIITDGVLTLSPADATNGGILTNGAQTIAGVKTFVSTISGSVSGNAATVTTNANLTGDITSTGNVTTIGNGKVTDAMLASSFATTTALANKVDKVNDKSLSTNDYTTTEKTKLGAISGSNTGDQTLSGLGAVAENTAITGATKTKVTYDAKGLVTAGTDATTADIVASTDKKYVTDAQLAVVGNTSGTNTGDETASGIRTKLGVTTLSGSNTGDQTLSGLGAVAENTAITGATKTKVTYDAKGLVTAGADATTADIVASTDKKYVTDAQLAVVGNTSGTNTGDETASGIRTKLGVTTLSGSNTGDQDLTSFATTTSPLFTGIPTAPTATTETNTDQIATTAYVNAVLSKASVVDGFAGAIWNSATTGTLNGIGFTLSNLVSSPPDPWDLTTSAFSQKLSISQPMIAYAVSDDWKVVFLSEIANLKIFCKFWRPGNYVFDQPFTIVSGTGLTKSSNTLTVVSGFGNGIIEFAGPITELNVDSDQDIINNRSGQLLTFASVIPGTNNTQLATTTFVSNAIEGKFVDLTTAQTIAGVKTFSSDANINGITVGRGAGNIGTNTAIGTNALVSNTTGSRNTALGAFADVSSNDLINATAIGNEAIVTASNSIQLGSTAVTNVKTSGTLTAGAVTYTSTKGTANQVLITDANGVTSWATSSSSVASAGIWPITAINYGLDFFGTSLISASGFYNVIGNIVSFSGSLEFSGDGYSYSGYGSGNNLYIEIGLPVASNFTNLNDASGSVSGLGEGGYSSIPVSGYIKANNSVNKLRVYLIANDYMTARVENPKIAISGMYIIK